MREVRRFNRLCDEDSDSEVEVPAAMVARRARLGKKITQWRKAHAQTVQTGMSAPTMLVNVQQENAELRARVDQLESDNALMAEELDSYRAHEAEMEDAEGSEVSDSVGSTLCRIPNLHLANLTLWV